MIIMPHIADVIAAVCFVELLNRLIEMFPACREILALPTNASHRSGRSGGLQKIEQRVQQRFWCHV
jgi:hypothetical protein